MNEEELFCKLFPEYVVNGKPLSPYFDLFESGFEQAEKRINELETEVNRLKLNEQLAINNGKNLLKENAELKKKCYKKAVKDYCKVETQLTKAKEIIKKLYAVYYDPCVTESDLKYRDELFAEINQFLSEVEK